MTIFNKHIPTESKIITEGDLITFNVPMTEIQKLCNNIYKEKGSILKSIFATDEVKDNGVFKIYYIFGFKGETHFIAPFIEINDIDKLEFPSLTDTIY